MQTHLQIDRHLKKNDSSIFRIVLKTSQIIVILEFVVSQLGLTSVAG